MATAEDLKAAIEENLSKRGVLGEVKARLRKEVFEVLNSNLEYPNISGGAIATAKNNVCAAPDDTAAINDMIREYLNFHGYAQSVSVFAAETGCCSRDGFSAPVSAKTASTARFTLPTATGSKAKALPVVYGVLEGFRSARQAPQ